MCIIDDQKNEKFVLSQKRVIICFCISLGICLRFIMMSLGHNTDFESYCVVGDIAGNLRNVYAETNRYNYGPIFLIFQGLFYKIALLWNGSSIVIPFRILIVSLLTMADLGAFFIVEKKVSIRAGLIFFLNPISIIITGYHNQFDNIAVLLGLISLSYYNEETTFTKKDILFMLYMSLSLMMKHILFMIPLFLLLRTKLPWKKKAFYVTIPPAVFLLSFIPFFIGNTEALEGIKNNVFLYRSFANMPILQLFEKAFSIPSTIKFPLYLSLLLIISILIRDRPYDESFYIYLIAMVAFSSAIANQYLIIPIVGIFCLKYKIIKYIYLISGGLYLTLNQEGLNLLSRLSEGAVKNILIVYNENAYMILSWILCFMVIKYLVQKRKT